MHRLSSLVSALALSAAPALAQQIYTLDIDPANSAGTWGASTTVGNLANTTPYQFDGDLQISVMNSTPPFGSGEILTSNIVSIPTVLQGELPNPIPGLPPLADVELSDLIIEVSSNGSFAIDMQGNFSANTNVLITQGDLTIDPLAGPPITLSIAGAANTFPFDGNITQVGSEVVADVPVVASFVATLGALSAVATVQGDVLASAPIVGGGFFLNVNPLQSGQSSTATANNGTPNDLTYLAYSILGTGSTPVPQLNITLDLLVPRLAAGPTLSDANGNVTWTLNVPPGSAGFGIWLQAFQFGVTSNVPFEVIS